MNIPRKKKHSRELLKLPPGWSVHLGSWTWQCHGHHSWENDQTCRCLFGDVKPKEEEDDDDIYMYKLTYRNDVCIYLTLFIYWFWFAPCWDLYIWIYFDIRGSIWVCQQWSGEPCSKSFVEWLWVYQNNMEHSLHHSIFQRIFRGWGDPWHNIFFSYSNYSNI